MDTPFIFALTCFLLFAVVGWWRWCVYADGKKYRDENYLKCLARVDAFFALLQGLDDYVTWVRRDRIVSEFADAGKFFAGKSDYYQKEQKIRKFNEIYGDFQNYIKTYNKAFVKFQKEKYKDYFDNVESKKLDDQQRDAVVTDEYSNLIIAGAGSGKTLTILAKVKYLIEKKNVSPEKILLLSYTRKTVEELNARLGALNLKSSATTFHELGYRFIKKYAQKIPAVANENLLKKVITDFLGKGILADSLALQSFIQFMACYRGACADWHGSS